MLLLLALALILAVSGLIRTPQSLPVSVDGDTGEPLALPIIMYHSILKDSAAHGIYVVSPDTVAADMACLRERGYTAIFVSELVDYVENGAPLPDKPVIITLDDGNLNNLTYLVPLLEEYEMKAVISVVGSFTERAITEGDHNPAYSNLTWEEISALLASGRVEIGNHTYSMHDDPSRRGAMPRSGESPQEYRQALDGDLRKMQKALQEHCGVTPLVFAYPYGYIHQESLDVVRELGFKASFGCGEQVNFISRDAADLYCLGRYNRPSGVTSEQFIGKILAAAHDN